MQSRASIWSTLHGNTFPPKSHINQGLVNVPFWEYWTSPYSSHQKDHIPNGWVMFNGDMTNDPWINAINAMQAQSKILETCNLISELKETSL